MTVKKNFQYPCSLPVAPQINSCSSPPTSGGYLYISGENFGPIGTPVSVLVSQENCLEASVIENQTMIRCTAPPGVGVALVVVTVEGSSNTKILQYEGKSQSLIYTEKISSCPLVGVLLKQWRIRNNNSNSLLTIISNFKFKQGINFGPGPQGKYTIALVLDNDWFTKLTCVWVSQKVVKCIREQTELSPGFYFLSN